MNYHPLIQAIIYFAFGIPFVRSGIRVAVNAVDRRRFRSRAVVTAGTIVGHHVTYGRGNADSPFPSRTYYPIVAFTVQDGRVTRGQSRSPASGRVGSAATVYYDPASPAEIELRSQPVLDILTSGILLLPLGLALLIAGLFSLSSS